METGGRVKVHLKQMEDQTPESDVSEPEFESSLQAIMSELRSQRTEIVGRLDGIDTRLGDVTTQVAAIKSALVVTSQTLEQHKQRMDEVEQRVSTAEDTLISSTASIIRSEGRIYKLETKVDALVNKEMMKGLVLLGLPENAERELALIDYIQQKLPSWLKLSIDKPFELDQAMCSGRTPPESGRPPRPVLIRLSRIRDGHLILQVAKRTSMIEDGAKLTIRQDLPAEVRRKRRGFNGVIKVLIQKGMFRGCAYPHRLRVLHENKITLFDDQLEAEAFIESLRL